jgi:hypothetical protein
VKIGRSVVIFGVGGVGLNVVQFAHLAGANPIVAIDLINSKLEMAKARGATHTLNAAGIKDIPEAIREIVGVKGPDKVIETTGVKQVIEQAYDITHADGTCVLVGVPNEKVTIYTLPIHFNKVLTGSHGGDAAPHIDIPRLIRLTKADVCRSTALSPTIFPLENHRSTLCAAYRGPRANQYRRSTIAVILRECRTDSAVKLNPAPCASAKSTARNSGDVVPRITPPGASLRNACSFSTSYGYNRSNHGRTNRHGRDDQLLRQQFLARDCNPKSVTVHVRHQPADDFLQDSDAVDDACRVHADRLIENCWNVTAYSLPSGPFLAAPAS